MEEYKTKNKVFNSILEPVSTYLQKSNFDAQSNAFDTLGCSIENLWESVIKGIEFVDKEVVNAVDNFFETYKIIQEVDKPSAVQWRQFIITLHDILSKIDDYKIKQIDQSLSKCQTQLESLDNSLIPVYLKSWFKHFCQNIWHSLVLLQNRAAELESEIAKNHIFLHVVQLTTCLKLTLNLFRKELSNKILIMECRRFLIKRFIYCFDGIKRYIHEENCSGPSPGFIQWMDTTLDLVSATDPTENDTDHFETLKSAIEEVLCHAMSIAQICTAEDCKKIKAGIQTVLHEFNQLKTESAKSEKNPSLCNLYVDIVSDKLCSLERKVNTAVLNISLKVFSTLAVPLENLQHICEENNTSILSRSEDDLDELITALDTHVDCLIQVGMFAIACSTNASIVAKIRSCLASLEALESELVPALTSLYMEPSTVACLHARLFVDHWLEEVRKLKSDVCFIIDPVAFGMVVYEDFKVSLEGVTRFLTEKNTCFTKEMLTPICDRIQIYILVLKASITDMKLTNKSIIVRQYNKLMDIFFEVGAAITQISDNNERAYSKKLLKRLNILRTMFKRSIVSFSIDEKAASESLKEAESLKSITKREQVQNILYEESIKEFQHRGQQLLKDRSILYKTPKHCSKLLPVATPNRMTAPKCSTNKQMRLSFVRMIHRPTFNLTEPNNSLDLQITRILENLSGLTLVEE